MHIVISVLTALAGLIWALTMLHRSGVDLNSFNPFFWLRRRRWQKLHGTNPLYKLSSPIEVATVLVVALVKVEGEITREQKSSVLEIFTHEFHLSASQAGDAFSSSAFLLQNEMHIANSIKKIVDPCKNQFSPDQVSSLLSILNRVARLEGDASENQSELLAAITKAFGQTAETQQSAWG